MKTLRSYLVAAATAAILFSEHALDAQITSNIVQSAGLFFGSFNTNYTWTNCVLEMSSGYAQVTGVNAASKLDAQLDFGSAKQFDFGASLQFSGIGSVVNGAEARFGYAALEHYDTKVEAVLLAGYDATVANGQGVLVGSAVVEPALEFKKKPTPNTFAMLKISLPVKFVGKFNTSPTIEAGVGFTY
jgi:hypothetical protein